MSDSDENDMPIRNEEFETFQRRIRQTQNNTENHNVQYDPDMQNSAQGQMAYGMPNNTPDFNRMMETITALMTQNSIMLNMIQQRQQSENMHDIRLNSGNNNANDEQVKNFHIMPDLSKTIEDFTGEKGPYDAKLWLKQLETTAKLHSWPEAFLFETARSHLRGAAKFWYRGREDITDWTKFRAAFTKTFLISKTKTELWKEMQSRKCKIRKKNISVYFHEKISLCREIGLSFEEIKEQVIVGLWSKELANFLITKEHKDEDELFKDVIHYERIRLARVERVYDRNHRSNEKATHETKKVFTETNNQKPPLKNEKGDMKCYNCDQFGHIAKNCSKEKRVYKCLRCGEEGHTPRHCSKPKPMDKGEVKLITNDQTSFVAKYIKEVKLDDKTYVAMIDPGSSDCTIKATAAITGNFQINRDECELKGFGNVSNLVKSCGTISTELCVDNVSAKNIKMRIVPDDVQPTDVIIGRSFTELNHVVYYKVNDKLCFEERDKINLPIQIQDDKSSVVKITENCTVHPNSMLFLNAQVGNAQCFVPTINLSHEIKNLDIGAELNEKILAINELPYVVESREVEPVTMEELNLDDNVTDD
ncbi:hypothetical protein NQ317_005406 [Molorchus minor]|uniref:CCHC-type domain-containing protein n=1 Tax=Molorchus minor TaxID=1323400 RepID=A0ABQ9IPT3_9CUCU|nr:hypothetical protein NQ317_005406 [Molorchus minor]